MRLLAIDCGTERLSVALGDTGAGAEGRPRLVHEGAGGAQASAALIPAVLQLLAQAGWSIGSLDAIAFGQGPGSFTGLRTACSVAQGLAHGAGVPLVPVPTLLLLAVQAVKVARQAVAIGGAGEDSPIEVVAALDARMGEVYTAPYRFAPGAALPEGEPSDWTARARLCRPEELAVPAGGWLAGTAVAAWPERCEALAPGHALALWPDAAVMLDVAAALAARGCTVPAAQALPLYIRDKVAFTTAERAERAAQAEQAPRAASTPDTPR